MIVDWTAIGENRQELITSVGGETADPQQALIFIGAIASGVLMFVARRLRRNSKSSLF